MNKLMGRKILWVLVVCFISSVVCGLTANALRNDSLLQFSTSNPSFINVSAITHTYNSYNGITPAYIAQPLVSASQFILKSPSLFGNLLILGIAMAGFLLFLRRLANDTRYSKWLALSYSILVILTSITQSV